MLRVFLVLDDYNELVYLQSLLKKMGFDVESLQSARTYADVSLGFNPQILITTARGNKVDGLALARSITRRQGLPKIIALNSSGPAINPAEFERAEIDEILESPVNPKKLLSTMAKLGGLDEAALLEKYIKVRVHSQNVDAGPDTIAVFDQPDSLGDEADRPRFPLKKSSEKPTDESPSTIRQSRFDQWVEKVGPLPVRHFDRSKILEVNRRIREQGSVDDIDEIEGDRKSFVKALFKKNKK
jgi:CheY-like chemotaxis protein